jgi:hypothetical protein
MYQAMDQGTKSPVATRLKRIDGQVDGTIRMVEEGRYGVDVLTRISAVRAAAADLREPCSPLRCRRAATSGAADAPRVDHHDQQ